MKKIGIIKERKVPPDLRVALIPHQVKLLEERYPDLLIEVEHSDIRCYKDIEYEKAGAVLVSAAEDADLLIGIKEVPVDFLVPDKTFMFFSHTIKKQPHNLKLIRAAIEKKIRLIDYEVMTDEKGLRLIAFGKYAGMVGAHYALMMWGLKTGFYSLKKAAECHDYKEMAAQYASIDMGNPKILVTGAGRVAHGAVQVLHDAGIKKVSQKDFLSRSFDHAVYTQVDVNVMNRRKDGQSFDFPHFFAHPEAYESCFYPYLTVADVLINCIYWDPKAPRCFEISDIHKPDFHLRLIADISCDIEGSIPITFHSTSTQKPFTGFKLSTLDECEPFQKDSLDLMAVDNLPTELPRDASASFGRKMLDIILPLYLTNPEDPVFERATIVRNGKLCDRYAYLKNWIEGKE